MKRKKNKRKFKTSRGSIKSLTWQTIVCIIIILLIIAAKKMDFALVNNGIAVLEKQLNKNYEVTEIMKATKEVVVSLRSESKSPCFIMPVDEPGIKAACAGSADKSVIIFPADKELQVHASGGGTVSLVELGDNSKIKIEISHGNNIVTEYLGLTDIYVKHLAKVKQGQIIASVRKGEENDLFFALKNKGLRVEPLEYMRD